MKKSALIKGLLIAASLPLLASCVVYERQPPVAEGVPAGGAVVVDTAPPPPQVEVVPACPGPAALWFWVPGYWAWHGQWIWVGGHWAARPHPHAVWVAGHWGRRHHGYVWIEGHWR